MAGARRLVGSDSSTASTSLASPALTSWAPQRSSNCAATAQSERALQWRRASTKWPSCSSQAHAARSIVRPSFSFMGSTDKGGVSISALRENHPNCRPWPCTKRPRPRAAILGFPPPPSLRALAELWGGKASPCHHRYQPPHLVRLGSEDLGGQVAVHAAPRLAGTLEDSLALGRGRAAGPRQPIALRPASLQSARYKRASGAWIGISGDPPRQARPPPPR